MWKRTLYDVWSTYERDGADNSYGKGGEKKEDEVDVGNVMDW